MIPPPVNHLIMTPRILTLRIVLHTAIRLITIPLIIAAAILTAQAMAALIAVRIAVAVIVADAIAEDHHLTDTLWERKIFKAESEV